MILRYLSQAAVRGSVVLCLVHALTASAQISFGGRPIGLSPGADLLASSPTVVLPEVDRLALIAEDEAALASGQKGPYRFGLNHAVDLGIATHGSWTTLRNGDRVWRLSIRCPQAFSINFVFDEYMIPDGGTVHVYNDMGDQLGAFTAASNGGRTSMGVTQLRGDRITIEYREPFAHAGMGRLHIAQVTHGYRDIFNLAKDFGESGDCNINVICPEGDPWRDQIRAVGIITVGGSGFCSGTLLNNCAEDGIPYFLTANHCLDPDVANWVFRFNWDSPVCAPTQNGPVDQTISGCELLVNNAATDVALLRLNTTPPADYAVYYSGWDHSALPAQQVTGIHHPSGDIKKISISNGPTTAVTFDDAECWNVATWDAGTTEQGSSGSGLWNQNKQLVGQLFGGSAECGNSVDDNYGRFDLSWPLLAPWLGIACGDTLGGWDPEEAEPIEFDAAITSINNIAELECGEDSISPVVTLKNNGLTVLTSVLITYGVQGSASYTHQWTGSLQTAQTTTVDLAAIPLISGENILTVSSSDPNGNVDQVPENDAWTITFNASPTVGLVNLILTLDNYGSDVTWNLATEAGTVLYEGGPYEDFDNGVIDSVAFCLTNGCYTFTINDFFGNGLCCDDGEGGYVIRDGFGTVFGESDGQYTDQNVNEFCIAGVGVREAALAEIRVSPNPSNGLFRIDLNEGRALGYWVTDALGRQVLAGSWNNAAQAMLDLSGHAAGNYHLLVNDDHSRVVRHLVITR